MFTFITRIRTQVPSRFRTFSARLKMLLSAYPLLSFTMLLLLFVGLIALGNTLRQPETNTEKATVAPKEIQVFSLGTTPNITVQAKVEKSGVIKIVALSGGVVQKIRVDEGSEVKRGTQLFSLSTNYQGGNVLSLSRQISQKSYDATLKNYDLQKESIELNRQVAAKSESQQSRLREIARQSIDDTKILITLNEEINASLDKQIKNLENLNTNGASDSAILQLKSSKAQVLAGLSGLRTGLRNTEYLNDDNKESADITRIVKENTLKQLELQQRALDLGKELSLLNLKISQVSEAVMYPAAPCPGVVERIYVKVGQFVAPGTVLASIRGNDDTAQAVTLVSGEIARSLSRLESSSFTISGQKYQITPQYIALEPTDGVLHAVTYTLPDVVAATLAQGEFVEVSLPIAGELSNSPRPFVPLDAIYQSQEGAYVFVVDGSSFPTIAKSHQITLGAVYGKYVEVTDGLDLGDKVILSRSVLDGDAITIQE